MSETELEFDELVPLSRRVESTHEPIPQLPQEETVVYETLIDEHYSTEASVDGDGVVSGRLIAKHHTRTEDGNVRDLGYEVLLECDLLPSDPEDLWGKMKDGRGKILSTFRGPGDSFTGEFQIIDLSIELPPDGAICSDIELWLDNPDLSETVFNELERVYQKQHDEFSGEGS